MEANRLLCPACHKLVAIASPDFDGEISLYCRRSKARFGSEREGLPELRCPTCRKHLASGRITTGEVNVTCSRCSMLVAFGASGGRMIESPRHTGPKLRPKPMADDELLSYIEDRWLALRLTGVQRSADMASGIRFDVFTRDGFRCRYCARGPADGVLLEADHVVPRSEGGPDTMDNLVTACRDCNRGKSAKSVDTVPETAYLPP